jgi:hypothetical protein
VLKWLVMDVMEGSVIGERGMIRVLEGREVRGGVGEVFSFVFWKRGGHLLEWRAE